MGANVDYQKLSKVSIVEELTFKPIVATDKPELSPIIAMRRFNEKTIVPFFWAISNGLYSQPESIKRLKIENELFFNGNLRSDQIEICLQAEEQLHQFKTTTLWVYPGAGKTVMGLFLALKFRDTRQILIALTSTTLITSWKGTIEQFCPNASTFVVPPTTLSKKQMDQLEKADIIICLDGRIHHLPEKILNDIGVLIVDEAHTWCNTQRRVDNLLSIRPRYIILETATFLKDNGMHRLLHVIAGTHHIRREFNQKVIVTRVLTDLKVAEKMTDKSNISLFRQLLVNHPDYNQLIYDQILKKLPQKILVLTWLTSHVESLYSFLLSKNICVSCMYAHKKNYDECDVLIGTIGKIGVGFDEKTICNNFNGKRLSVVLLPLSIKDNALLEQCLGRALRSDSAEFVLFIENHYLSMNHWRKNYNWFCNRNINDIVYH